MANALVTSCIVIAFTLLNCWFVYISFTPNRDLEAELQAINTLHFPQQNLHNSTQDTYPPPPPPTPPPPPSSCDVFRGNWIQDSTPPLYTNETCKFIQPNQNCIKNGRPDKDYLNWRWKPDECELPFLDPLHFLELMSGKKMIFIGDSMARNHMQSLLCALAQVITNQLKLSPTLSQVEEPHKLEKPEVIFFEESEKEMRWGFDKYNFTLTHIWSPFLVKFSVKQDLYSVYLDVPDEIWSSKVHDYDVAVVSTGYWYYRSSVYHLNDAVLGCNPCKDLSYKLLDQLEAYRIAHENVLRYLVSSFTGTTILRSVTVDHFEHGAWYSGGVCNRTSPFTPGAGPTLPFMSQRMNRIQVEEVEKARRNADTLKLSVLNVTYSAFMRPDGHPNFFKIQQPGKPPQNDCLHWCLPGPVDLWNQLIYHTLKKLKNI